VLYRPLNIQEMQQVTNLMLKEIQVGLSQKGIEFQITPNLIEKLTQIGFDPVFGGRALRRALQNNIENPLARALLAHTIQPGEIIEIDPSTWQVNIKKKLINCNIIMFAKSKKFHFLHFLPSLSF